VLLVVTVTPGANPTSTGTTVIGDLSSIGDSAVRMLNDNGTSGDETAGDGKYSYQVTVSSGTAAGSKSLPISIRDLQFRSSTTTIQLTVTSQTPTPTNPTGVAAASPGTVAVGQVLLLSVAVTPGTNRRAPESPSSETSVQSGVGVAAIQ